MNCEELKNIITDYIFNKLSEKRIEDFNNHLKSCEDCNRLYNNVKNTFGLLKPKSEIDEQAFYFTKLKQKMETKNAPKESIFSGLLTRKFVQPIIYLSSIIIAVYMGILIGSNIGTNELTQFTELKEDDNYIKTYTEYQYLNDFEIETIENLFINEDTLNQ